MKHYEHLNADIENRDKQAANLQLAKMDTFPLILHQQAMKVTPFCTEST